MNIWDLGVLLFHHQFIVNNYNFSKHCYKYHYYYYYRKLHVTIIFHCFSVCCLFFLSDAFLTGAFFEGISCYASCSVLWHLLVQAFLIVSSRSMPYYPCYCRAISSVHLGSAIWHLLSKLLISWKTARWRCKLFHWHIFCYRSKICPGDESGEQMASTEDLRKKKIICFWRELNLNRPLANLTLYL